MKLTSDRNQCPTCSEYFNSTYGFDKHRTGPHTQRSCLSPAQMELKGMSKNNAGFWVTERLTEKDIYSRGREGFKGLLGVT